MLNTVKVEKLEVKLAGDAVLTIGPIEISYECTPQEFADTVNVVMKSIQSDIQEIERMAQAFTLNLGSIN